jgi:hypothetical protein
LTAGVNISATRALRAYFPRVSIVPAEAAVRLLSAARLIPISTLGPCLNRPDLN